MNTNQLQNEYVETKRHKLVGTFNTPIMLTPCLTKIKRLKVAHLNDVQQIFIVLEDMVPTFPNPKSYYAMCQLYTCIKVEIAPSLIIGAHIIEHEFFMM
jgi:hypothetical protein